MCKSSFLASTFLGRKKKQSREDEKHKQGCACSAKTKGKTHTHTPQAVVELRSYPTSTVLLCVFTTLIVVVTQPVTAAGQCGGGGLSVIPPAGFRNRKITGLCLHVGAGVQSVQQVRCGRWEGLEGDEVHQVALRWGHAVWEEVDERVEELRPLSVRLVYV